MPCRATQDRWVIVKDSDKTWSTGRGNGKPLQYSYTNINSVKRRKDMTLESETPDQKVSSMVLRKSRGQLLTVPERMKCLGKSRNDVELWILSGDESSLFQ